METVTEDLSRNLVFVDWRGGGWRERGGGGGGHPRAWTPTVISEAHHPRSSNLHLVCTRIGLKWCRRCL